MNVRPGIVAVAVLAAACGGGSMEMGGGCGPATCGGCCDGTGVCQPGVTEATCGGGGRACDVCAVGQVCGAGRCGAAAGVGGGAGGGFGGGVASVGGGFGGSGGGAASAGGGMGGAGGGCAPTTCAAQGKNCGSIPDGCGGTLGCGSCAAGTTCGGGGTSNVCGALALDVKPFKVSGAVTLNGATPQTTCTGTGQSKADVTFTDAALGKSVKAEILCNNTAFTYAVDLWPGTFAVTVRSESYGTTNLPLRATFHLPAPLTFTGPASNVGIDVKVHSVSGTLTLNGGAIPVPAACTYSKAELTFINVADDEYSEQKTSIACAATGGAWSMPLYPGTYRVRAELYALGAGRMLVTQSFVVAGAASNQTLALKTATVAGKLTLQGMTPQINGARCGTYPDHAKASLQFVDAAGERFSVLVRCDAPAFAFSGSLAHGTYAVSASGYNDNGWANSNIPGTPAPVAQGFSVTGPISGQTFDYRTQTVTGNVTLDGQVPADTAMCFSGDKARVRFTNKATGSVADAVVPCGAATYAFTTTLFPGTYEVRVNGSQYTALPEVAYPADASAGYLAGQLVVGTGAVPGQLFDVKSAAVTGTLTLNGAVPADLGTACLNSPNVDKAVVTFTEKSKGYVLASRVRCSSATYAYGAALYPGTWDVRVAGVSNRSALPAAAYQAEGAWVVAAGAATKVLDVKTVAVAGKVTLAGGAPMDVGTHCAMFPNDPKAVVTFRDAARGYALPVNVLCGGGFGFTAALFPGTYEVWVTGSAWSNLPAGDVLVTPALMVQ